MEVVYPSDRLFVTTLADQITGAALDVGYGSGHWTSYLAERGVAVHGIDRVAEFIAYARATGVRVVVERKLPIRPAGVSGGLWFSAVALSVEVAVGGQSKFKSQMSFSCTVGGSKHSVECSTRLIGAGPQCEQNS